MCNMQRKNRCITMFVEMRLVWLWVMLVLASECYGCLEQERIALLQLKASINHPNGYSLPTWKDAWEGEATTNCCEWERVQCNTTTGRVIQLSLDSTRNYMEDWYLNASMFLPFEELESLNLSSNSLVGWLENEGFKKLAKLNNLQVLDLYYNGFNNNIISTLDGLRSLKSLNLSRNSLKGTFNIDDLRNLNNLMELDISYNFELDSFITHSGFEKLAKLNNLQVLDLYYNSFNNSILPTLGGLRSLKSLNLGRNRLKGTFNIDDLRNLNNLMELDISYNFELDSFITHSGFERLSILGKLEVLHLNDNSFNNSILPSLAVLSSLKTLDLSFNNLNGSIDKGEFCNMSNLEELDLSFNDIDDIKGLKSLSKLKTLNLRRNKLQGLITSNGLDGLKHLQDLYLDYSSIDKSFLCYVGVMSSLRVLTLRGNGLNGSLPNQGWCELSNLQELDLSENGFEGMLPSCLGDLTSIRLLDFSFNQFTGNIALSPLTKLITLEYLILPYNHFEIPISFVSFFNHSKLKVLLGDNNRMSYQIEFQTRIPKFQLQVFSLSNCGSNKLGMKLPHFLFYQYDLRIFDLSDNILVGKFPVWLLENNTRLEVLSLRNGYLTGPFLLPSYPNLQASSIDISNNHLEGPIPINIGLIFPILLDLNMSRNQFQGYIPTSLGDMHSLRVLDLSNNNLSGQIPKHLFIGCYSLDFLKLSNNNLSGQLFPSFGNLTRLRYLYLDNNHFEGKIPDSMSILPLMAIGISNNHIYGKLPRWIGNMSELMGISMFSNHFEGPLPVEFCKLQSLVFLDISDNNLFGTIPSCFNQSKIRHVHLNRNKLRGSMTHAFYNISSLVTLDISDNNLSGTIPSWIGNLSALSILLLKFNNFEGEIPIQLCQLKQLSILDLSENSFSGPIPHCFIDIPFETTDTKSYLETDWYGIDSEYTFWSFVEGSKSLGKHYALDYGIYRFKSLDVQQEVEFTTKHGSYAYKGNILNYMSGIDLSCNHLTGEIPPEMGNLSNIRALNLSHNNISGSIPSTFSHLKQLESLDLSYNNLNGRIPSQLIELGNLAVFSVAYNNLSGATPDRKAQFATFEENSYEGNSFLCGLPLQTNCNETVPTSTMSKALERKVEDGGLIDMGVFYVSFLGSYITVLLGIAAVLFINPHWRQAWFHLIEVCMTSWYYFVLDNFRKILWNRNM